MAETKSAKRRFAILGGGNLGQALARELIFTGARIDAGRAYEIGLVNRVVEDHQVLEGQGADGFLVPETRRGQLANDLPQLTHGVETVIAIAT